jgi:hypothetical protein
MKTIETPYIRALLEKAEEEPAFNSACWFAFAVAGITALCEIADRLAYLADTIQIHQES